MKLTDQDCDAEHETPVPGVPLVGALLDLAQTLDQLQQRMLTFQNHSLALGRVHVLPSQSAAGGSEGRSNL